METSVVAGLLINCEIRNMALDTHCVIYCIFAAIFVGCCLCNIKLTHSHGLAKVLEHSQEGSRGLKYFGGYCFSSQIKILGTFDGGVMAQLDPILQQIKLL